MKSAAIFVILLCLTPMLFGECVTIKDGTLAYAVGHYLAGQALKPGYDSFGYNYQAHMFNGSYFNAYAGGAGFPPYDGDEAAYLAANPTAAGHWAWPYRTTTVNMKWNDAWLSNMDCDADGKLDRHYGFPSYIGTGAWETNHQSDTYLLDETDPKSLVHWTYFVKIVAVPGDAVLEAGYWKTPDGVEIGPAIWEDFAIIQEVSNDPGTGIHGVQYKSPASPGFGYYQP